MADTLDPRFIDAIASVPTAAWMSWFHDVAPVASPHAAGQPTLITSFALPPGNGSAAICLLETAAGGAAAELHQVAVRQWMGSAPDDARVLHQHLDPDGLPVWTLAAAWADSDLRAWLREALTAGVSLRSDGWEWLAAPERPTAARVSFGSSRQVEGRRHDVILFEPGAVAVVYRRMTRGGQPELDLLRHLERVPGVRVAPTMLGSAILRSPEGIRSASAVLEDIVPSADTARTVIVGRLHRALDGDPSLQAVALDDVRAVGVITHEMHAALGRPFEQGVLAGAVPATAADVDAWVARALVAITAAGAGLRASVDPAGALTAALEALPAKLQQFAAAAESAPGLIHRIHGNLGLDMVLMSPPRSLSIVEFDGDALLPDTERIAPQSPWRDVARLLVSLADAAAQAAGLAGGDDKAFEIAWLWEREARKAVLEGYGTGGGALHAMLAIFEMEFAARHLLDALAGGLTTAVAAHTLERLTRTIV
jgi:predicted trehalose synthase